MHHESIFYNEHYNVQKIVSGLIADFPSQRQCISDQKDEMKPTTLCKGLVNIQCTIYSDNSFKITQSKNF